MKQVRFGKLAFSQLNGANFYPKTSIFGYFALRLSEKCSGVETVHIFTFLEVSGG